jgi:hypothetical protein
MNVTRFPVGPSRRLANRRGKRSVSCIVSDRWLRFEPKAGDAGTEGRVVTVNVMTGAFEGDRKLCGLIVPLNELRRVVDSYGTKKDE